MLVAARLGNLGADDQANAGAPTETASSATSVATQPGATPTEREGEGAAASPTPGPSPTPVDVGEVGTAKQAAEAFAEVWSAGNFDQLYDLISSAAQARISRADFVARYQGIAAEAGLVSVAASITGGRDDDEFFPMHVEFESTRIGHFADENQVPVVKEGDAYKVDWTPSLIFAGLGDGFVRWTSETPQRGRILDRKGRPLAAMGRISRVGVVPGKITDERALLEKLSQLLNLPQEIIQARYENGQPDWFMPVKDLPDQMDQALIDQLVAIPGVAIQKWPARVYPAGAAAAHITGYLSEVTAEELPALSERGYVAGDLIGRGGIEAAAEEWLAGKRGGILALVAPDGSTLRVLGAVEPEPAHDVVLTIDLDIQLAADLAVGDVLGSAVVLDPNNGEVLAMVSHPSFDPNAFILGITDEQWAQLNDPVRQPLVNRTTLVGYPTGSTFKVVTAAAGMVHLGYNAGTPVNCPGEFTIPGSGQVWKDWVPGGQGAMDLHTAIVRSCNTVFYKMGADLDDANEMFLPNMARSFGFGAPTGVEIDEVAGIVPDPTWKVSNVGDFWATGDAVNLAIGQGYFLATPLQLANAYAALANGGTLYTPHMILDVVRLDGSVAYSSPVQEKGKLPLSPDQIGVIRAAMYDVINAPNGTATQAFAGVDYAVSGKTGTAETGIVGEQPHGWFGSFTPSDAPRITVVTMVEHGVAGSVAAAPIARKIIDAWYAANGG